MLIGATHIIISSLTQPDRRKWTWVSPDSKTRNQIDFISINGCFRNAVKQAKSYPGADWECNHTQVVCKLQATFRKTKVAKSAPKLNYPTLTCNKNIRQELALKVQNRFELLELAGASQWDTQKQHPQNQQ